jgi:hypothetical protein
VTETFPIRVREPDAPIASDEAISVGGVSDTGADLALPQFVAATWWFEQVAVADARRNVSGRQRLACVEQDLNDGLVQLHRACDLRRLVGASRRFLSPPTG